MVNFLASTPVWFESSIKLQLKREYIWMNRKQANVKFDFNESKKGGVWRKLLTSVSTWHYRRESKTKIYFVKQNYEGIFSLISKNLRCKLINVLKNFLNKLDSSVWKVHNQLHIQFKHFYDRIFLPCRAFCKYKRTTPSRSTDIVFAHN
jgi:hypothetical protein